MSARTSRVRVWIGLLAVGLLLVAGLAAPASAALPAMPTGLTPSNAGVSGTPVLQWNHVRGATSYRVDIAPDASFSTSVASYGTVNLRLVPTVPLVDGGDSQIHWRVSAVNATGTGQPANATFSRGSLAGPALVSPANGATLQQPTEPPVLSWSPVAGAVSYTIQVDTDESFVPPFTVDNAVVSTTSHLIPTPLIAQQYHWRVRASLANGAETQWSVVHTFRPTGLLPAALQSPMDHPDTKVVDVVLDWAPVAGATKYDLQISTDENFLSGLIAANGLVGTRYSPPTTLANDQYWWRVRPYDAGGNFLDWSAVPIWTFQRHWPHQPALVHPVDDTVMTDPVYFEWKSVPHASSYTLQMHTSADFEPANQTISCTTVHTTFVPTHGSNCWPGAANSYYWRVVANDGPSGVVTDRIVSQVAHFHYLPDMVDLSTATPADGATVAVPTLSWQPAKEAAQYRVYVTATDGGGGSVGGFTTAATSFTPRVPLTVGRSYRWWVQTVSHSGRLGSVLVPEAQRTFTVGEQPTATADAPAPTAPIDGASFVRFPTLTWTPVAGATHYLVGLRPANSIQAFTWLGTKFGYPAGDFEAVDPYLGVGAWEWSVRAYNGTTLLGQSPSSRTFTMDNLAPVTGQSAALSGAASLSPSRCLKSLPEGRCEDLRSTPVLRWTPVPGAGYYKVTLSRDAEMTSVISTTVVDQNMFLPASALADSQAGSAYHWFVQPCKAGSKCSPLGHAKHAFNKRSNGVQLLSPVDSLETKVPHTVTFRWRPWIETNRSIVGMDAETGVNPELEARSYRIDVATDEGFQQVIDSVTVDQTTYTAYGKAYPEGPLYWRVFAIDGSANLLTPSATWRLDKESPRPILLRPKGDIVINATEPFRWQPEDYAVAYDIEVNKDDNPALASRIIAASSRMVAYTTTRPLPASAVPYLWRVRTVNGSGYRGEWSAWGRFTVKGQAPAQVAPLAGATVSATRSLFTWDAGHGAANYVFERRMRGSTTILESQRTAALGFAPWARLPEGSQEWRVTALDGVGQVLGRSPWRSFVVDSTAPRVVSKSPTRYASPTANFVAKFSEPVKGVSGRTMRIYRTGATTPLRARVTLSTDRKTAVLNPSRNLVRGRYYTIRLTRGITDLRGNRLAATAWKVRAR